MTSWGNLDRRLFERRDLRSDIEIGNPRSTEGKGRGEKGVGDGHGKMGTSRCVCVWATTTKTKKRVGMNL